MGTQRIPDLPRLLFGGVVGFAFMMVVVRVFVVNDFDYLIIREGVETVLEGGNPWAGKSLYYNPPLSVFFLWPMLFLDAKSMIVLGGTLLIALVFYLEAWVALAWFATNALLWLVAAGNVDLYAMGAGLLILLWSEKIGNRTWLSALVRVVGYGFLLVKPQGGFFIVLLYVLLKKDWRGVLLGLLIYGLPFLRLYPDWLRVILFDPPTPQDVASHSVMGKFGVWFAVPLALWIILARRWKFWQLGAALGQILSPYGMPGVPILLILTAVKRRAAIPIVIVFSACLALLTWRTDIPAGPDYYTDIGRFMTIYHLGMLALSLILACFQPEDEDDGPSVIRMSDWFQKNLLKREQDA